MKKFIIALVTMLLTFSMVIPAFAEDLTLVYKTADSWPANNEQGTTVGYKGWYYQYKTGETLDTYENMAWLNENNWRRYVVYGTDGKTVTNFISGSTIQPAVDVPSACMWIAPISGVVRLEAENGIHKSNDMGSVVTAKIIHCDKAFKNEKTIWTKDIEGNDTVGESNKYVIEEPVKAGDRIYFEISCKSSAHATTVWSPQIEYLQAIDFSVNDARVTSSEEIKPGDSVNCTLYNKESIEENAIVYFTFTDDKDRPRMITIPQNIDFTTAERTKTMDLTLNVPLEDGVSNYKGWTLKLFALTAKEGRFFTLDASDVLCIK